MGQFRSDLMEKETNGNTMYDDGEPNSITVTGEEWWIKYHGLTEELPWPQDEIDDSNLSQVYKDAPLPSLGVSVAGDRGDMGKVEYDNGGAAAGEMCHRWQMDNCPLGMEVRDQRCRTNMVRWNSGAQNDMQKIHEWVRSRGSIMRIGQDRPYPIHRMGMSSHWMSPRSISAMP